MKHITLLGIVFALIASSGCEKKAVPVMPDPALAQVKILEDQARKDRLQIARLRADIAIFRARAAVNGYGDETEEEKLRWDLESEQGSKGFDEKVRKMQAEFGK
ncbi:MAG: hypothetical protein ABIS50_11460 [Luteolibacter sp.]|uniref:hypothetical protein n=1 Tax=Luteolibacter sp. TaxID=1962973 RepID=UPI003263932C